MKNNQKESAELIDLWKEKPDLIREFIGLTSQYTQLCNEISYILEKRLYENNVKTSSITYRVKTLDSLAEKINRKSYSEPLKKITDIAGVRVVFLYTDDFKKIEKLIEENFIIIEKVDKIKELGNSFGYSAIHYLVQLKNETSGARYEDLKELICEIQVRTILQDAWAIIDHHLVYKKEEMIPGVIKRSLTQIAAILEAADDLFNKAKKDRETYVIEAEKLRFDELLSKPINLDTVEAFLKLKFPSDMKISHGNNHISIVLNSLDLIKYKIIGDLDNCYERTKKALEKILIEKPIDTAAGIIANSIALDDYEYRNEGWDYSDIDLFEKYEYLVEKKR